MASEPKYSVGKFFKRVDGAVKLRESAKYDETWSKMIRVYSNQYAYDELSMYEDIIAPNMVFSTVNVIVPSVAINYPKITVTARGPEDEGRAEIVEYVANYYWRHFDVHEEFRAVIKDFVIIGHGWLKSTWAFKEKKVDLAPDEWKQIVTQALTERNLAMEQAKIQGLDVEFPTDREIIQSIPTWKMEVTEDHPIVERVSPFDMFVDPAATRLKDARWIAQRAYVPIEVAKDNDAWDEKARKHLQPKAQNRESVDVLRDGEQRTKDTEFAIVWEYYDTIKDEFCVFSEGCDYFLVEPTKTSYLGGHPFVMVSNYSVPEKFYPIGDVETILPLQLELATTRTQLINDRKRFRRMYMVRSSRVGDDGINAILSGDDNAIIEIDDDTPFSELIAPLQTTPLTPEFYNQSSMIIDDINFTSGVTEYQRGNLSEIRRTATEASMIQDAANARAADKLATVERAIGEVAERVVALAQENLTTDQVAKIVDDDGATQWEPFDRESILGQYDFTVEAGSTQPQNETFRRQSAMQLMETMMPFMQMGIVNPVQLVSHVMKNGFGIKNPELFLQQPPPPMPPAPGEGAEGSPADQPMPLQ